MAKPSKMPEYSPQYLKRVEVEQPEYEEVAIVSSVDAKIKVTNTPSGREYVFLGAGSVVNVDKRDEEFLLNKRQGERQCCGGTENGNQVFRLVEK